jgi:hypothetical protein
MSLIINENTKIIDSELLDQNDITLVYIKDYFRPYQVWSKDGEVMYGTFRPDRIDDMALTIKMAYNFGFIDGEKYKLKSLKQQINDFLDIKKSE